MISIIVENKQGVIKGKFDRDGFKKIRGLPGRKRWRQQDLVFELSGANLEYLARNFPDVDWSSEARSRVEKIRQLRVVEKKTVKQKLEELPPEAYKFEFKTEPYDHQREAFFISRDLKNFGLFFEMGCGKTKVVIDTAAHLYAQGEIDCVVVLAPNGVHRQWINEQIGIHMPDWCPVRSFTYASGIMKKKGAMKELQEIVDDKDCLKFIAMNLESLSHDSGVNFCKKFLEYFKCLFVVDESSRIKTPGASRTKNIIKLGTFAPYKRIMSGTPVTKGAEDLFSQLKFLDEDILGYSSFYTFRNHFCDMGGWEGKQIVGYKNMEELQSRLDGHTYRITKKECLDLPEKIYVTREVELTSEQKKLYTQIKNDFLAQLSSGEIISAPLAITRMIRLQQIICGFLPFKEEDRFDIIPSNRIEICREVVDEALAHGGQIIIWGRFRYDIDQLCEEFDCVRYDGKTTADERTQAIELFRSGKKKIFIGNPKAAGIGLNLNVANTVIYYSNDFDAEIRWQSEDRAHRIGTEGNVTYVDIVAAKTIDSKIVKALKTKKSVADLIVDGVEDFLS